MGCRARSGGRVRRAEKRAGRKAVGALLAAVAFPMVTAAAGAQAYAAGPAGALVNAPRTAALEAACTVGASQVCQEAALAAIDQARATEGVGPLVLPAGYDQLGQAEQLLVLANLEREARGLPGFLGLSSSLDNLAVAGARADNDPNGPAGTQWGSNWAGGEGSALLADFDWMYDDGPGSPNLDCPAPSAPGCWGHRRNILGDYGADPSMGAAVTTVGGASSMAEVFSSAPPGGLDFALTAPSPAGATAVVAAPAVTTITPALLHIGVTRAVPNSASITVHDGGAPLLARAMVAGDHGHWAVTPTCQVGHGGPCHLVVTFVPYQTGPAHATVTVHLGARTARVGVYAYASHGYWEATDTGAVVAHAGGVLVGSAKSLDLHRPVAGIAATPDGGGYWEVAAGGGVFSFGDARFFGSAAGWHLTGPVVGIAAAPKGQGYWLLSRDGGVYSFGHARFYGAGSASQGGFVSITAGPRGKGYWLLTARGRVEAFGGARLFGSLPVGAGRAVGLAPAPDGAGYWVATAGGRVYGFGSALLSRPLSTGARDVVGIAAPPSGPGLYLSQGNGRVLALEGAPPAPAGSLPCGVGRVVGIATA